MWWKSRNNSCTHVSLKVDTFCLLYASHSICLSKWKQNIPFSIWLKHVESPFLVHTQIPKPERPYLLLYLFFIHSSWNIYGVYLSQHNAYGSLWAHLWIKTAIFKEATTAQISNQTYLIQMYLQQSSFPLFSFFSNFHPSCNLGEGEMPCTTIMYLVYLR